MTIVASYDWESDTFTQAPIATNGAVHHETPDAAFEADLDQLYSWWPGEAPAAPSCPEALFSLTLKGRLDGHETLLTVRGMTAAEFQTNLTAVRGLLDGPAVASPAPLQPSAGEAGHLPECPYGHGFLRKSTKHGGYYCPRKNAEDGTWCPGEA
jgi:hypothetical protein